MSQAAADPSPRAGSSGLLTGIFRALICACVAASTSARASVFYATGFESPQFATGPFPVYPANPDWGAWGVTGASSIQTGVIHTGTQAVLIDASAANTTQSGIWTEHENLGSLVTVSADVYLQSSSDPTAWQFAAYDWNESTWWFVGGFNPLSDGRLQLITAGFPQTAPVVTRDAWNNYRAVFDLESQTFDAYINNSLVAGDVPFLSPTTYVRGFQFDTFGREGNPNPPNDRAYFDNFSFQAVPEPMRGVMLTLGATAILLRRRR